MKYFVSYTTRDREITKDLLENLSKQIGNFGDVFIDIIDNNSFNKQARVISELENSDVLILIETSNIYKSKWVSIELKRAKERQIPIKRISFVELSNLTETEIINKLDLFEND